MMMILTMMRIRMLLVVALMMMMMQMMVVPRYPPFHGFGSHTYNWDCGSAFYDTSVQTLSNAHPILTKVFWLLFGSFQWICHTTSSVIQLLTQGRVPKLENLNQSVVKVLNPQSQLAVPTSVRGYLELILFIVEKELKDDECTLYIVQHC